MCDELVMEGERVDDLQRDGLRIIQDPAGFCFGSDAVILSDFVSGRKGERAIDLGTGSGILPILTHAKYGLNVTGVEIQSDVAERARRSVALNGLGNCIDIIEMRLQDAPKRFGRAFDIVMTNPPYRRLGSGFTQTADKIARARHEVDATLCDVLDAAAGLLGTGGRFFVVYPTERLSEMLTNCTLRKLTPKVLQILRPSATKPPHLFLLKCVYEGQDGLRVLPEYSL